MRAEFHPIDIRFTSDRLGFNAFRVLVREFLDEFEVGSGRRGVAFFGFGCRPVREKGRTLVTFQETPDHALESNRITFITPPGKPFVVSCRQAAGKVATFEVHPRFFEQVLRRAGIPASGIYSIPPPRFAINRRVEWLSELLTEETEQGCPRGRLYFENLATALVLAVASQIDPRLVHAGNPQAQHWRLRRAVALMQTDYRSKLSVEQLAEAVGLSPFHFSRLFHAAIGKSPHQFLLGLRLNHARLLLSTVGEERSIAEVAAESGFADQTHLARHFRRVYGMSPLEFRRAQK
jgi:AraC family transcriptional regulator